MRYQIEHNRSQTILGLFNFGKPRSLCSDAWVRVSRSAGIPTGWEIVIDLLAKLAASEGEVEKIDLEDWYRKKYGKSPDYSVLLDELAHTQAERQTLLRPYFEPNGEEREQGLKQPTTAHRAIAQLVADGLVRVIVTTNFDQLVETALRDVGITPTVLSTPDQVAGALPLIHTRCTVFKVHGDYTDPRILNSPVELNSYAPELDRLLDQIFDQFGVVVCGWSVITDWDVALRNAITRTPSRRFTMYWASRGELGAAAQTLVENRSAIVVPIQDADSFFGEVQDTVSSIVTFSRPHPLSTQAAVETLKRHMASPEHRIRLSDHMDNVVRQLSASIVGDAFPMNGAVTQETFTSRVSAYESACSTLMAMAVVAGYWAEDHHFQDWERAMRQIYDTREIGGNTVWLGLRNYPAFLLMHALGLGAVISGKLEFLGRLFNLTVNRRLGNIDQPNILIAMYADMIPPNWNRLLPGKERAYVPRSDHVHDVLSTVRGHLLINDEEFYYAFDKLEILMSLSVERNGQTSLNRFTLGAFFYRYANRQRAVREMRQSLEDDEGRSQFVVSDILGSNAKECSNAIDQFEDFIVRSSERYGIWTPS